jgi:hypothetical protein
VLAGSACQPPTPGLQCSQRARAASGTAVQWGSSHQARCSRHATAGAACPPWDTFPSAGLRGRPRPDSRHPVLAQHLVIQLQDIVTLPTTPRLVSASSQGACTGGGAAICTLVVAWSSGGVLQSLRAYRLPALLACGHSR